MHEFWTVRKKYLASSFLSKQDFTPYTYLTGSVWHAIECFYRKKWFQSSFKRTWLKDMKYLNWYMKWTCSCWQKSKLHCSNANETCALDNQSGFRLTKILFIDKLSSSVILTEFWSDDGTDNRFLANMHFAHSAKAASVFRKGLDSVVVISCTPACSDFLHPSIAVATIRFVARI